jgi:UDP-3-O-[3-hydroxymyristoyl] glucosamine N-acyltransferase
LGFVIEATYDAWQPEQSKSGVQTIEPSGFVAIAVFDSVAVGLGVTDMGTLVATGTVGVLGATVLVGSAVLVGATVTVGRTVFVGATVAVGAAVLVGAIVDVGTTAFADPELQAATNGISSTHAS